MTALGIDYGTVRVGIALSDEMELLATPLETYRRRSPEVDYQYIANLAVTHEATVLVVGLPINMDGTEGGSAKAARKFAAGLKQASGLTVELFDERLSSVSAEEAMIAAGLTRAHRKKRIDRVAAQMFLQAYLDAKRSQP